MAVTVKSDLMLEKSVMSHVAVCPVFCGTAGMSVSVLLYSTFLMMSSPPSTLKVTVKIFMLYLA